MKKRWITPFFDTTEVVNKKKKPNKETAQRSNLSADTTRSVTWIDKYAPRNVTDLVIHPKKVEELQGWFSKYKSDAPYSCRYLLLIGPPGSGKTACLRVIAKANDIKILEWITPLDREYNPDAYETRDYYSALELFKSFLLSTRYCTVSSQRDSRKIVLVKDFPNTFLRTPSSFHEVLNEFSAVKTYPIVFICNEENIARKLFPVELKEKLNVITIHFNAVHCKAVISALKRIITCETKLSKISVSNSDLENIYQCTGGDLRSAILKLYFNFAKLGNAAGETAAGLRNEFAKPKVARNKEQTKDKDENCDLFVGLGRILYSKREYKTEKEGSISNYKFVHEPGDIVQAFLPEANVFTSFLQENYLSRFSDLKDVAVAAETLSFADYLTEYRNNSEENEKIRLEIVCRSLMNANCKPVKQFKPFVKPSTYCIKSKSEVSKEIHSLFPDLEYNSSCDVILNVLPFIAKIFSELSEQQINYIRFRK